MVTVRVGVFRSNQDAPFRVSNFRNQKKGLFLVNFFGGPNFRPLEDSGISVFVTFVCFQLNYPPGN